MSKVDVYNTQGTKTTTVDIPNELFALPWNESLVYQVAVGMQANARQPVAHARERDEVKGGGTKPWRQKGTGRARHGSIRSPLWTGGGVTFGPRNDKSYRKRINKKMRAKALFTVLSRKFAEGNVLFIEDLKLDAPKTAQARDILSALSKVNGFESLLGKRANSAFITIPQNDMAVKKSFNNIGNVEVGEIRDLNVVDVLRHQYLIIVAPKEAFAALQERLPMNSEKGGEKMEQAAS